MLLGLMNLLFFSLGRGPQCFFFPCLIFSDRDWSLTVSFVLISGGFDVNTLIIIACLCIVYRSHPIYTSWLHLKKCLLVSLLGSSHPPTSLQKHWNLFIVLTLGRGGGQGHTSPPPPPMDFGRQDGAWGLQTPKAQKHRIGAESFCSFPTTLDLWGPVSSFQHLRCGHFPQCTCGGKRTITCLYPWPPKAKQNPDSTSSSEEPLGKERKKEKNKQTNECMISREEKCNKCGSLFFLLLLLLFRS